MQTFRFIVPVLVVALQSSAAMSQQPWQVFFIGDSRSHPEVLQQTIQTMVALDDQAVAIFNAGDLTADGKASQWQAHMQALATGGGGVVRADVTDFGPWTRYLGTVGNHDAHDRSWRANWDNYLSGQKDLPVANNGVYFSLVYQNAMFFILDSEHPSAAQTQWLRDAAQSQQAQQATWKIAIFHHPVYPCNGKSPFDEGLEWVQIFEDTNFDLVHVAHSHTFERSCPMREGKCVDGGVVYLNSSGAGAPSRSVSPDKRDTVSYKGRRDAYSCKEILKASGAYWHFFCHSIVDTQRLDVACYSHDDTSVTYDQFRLSKTGQAICTDNDGDGYGTPASPACAQPDLDCDDTNANMNPGIPGSCTCTDNDGDGYGTPASPACAQPDLDCDDTNANINPGVAGSCTCTDNDRDGFGVPGSPACRYPQQDCNDNNALSNPRIPGSCTCTDNDGDGYGDPGSAACVNRFRDCDDTNANVNPGIAGSCGSPGSSSGPAAACFDADSDGYGNPASPACLYPLQDCNDNNANVHPGIVGSCNTPNGNRNTVPSQLQSTGSVALGNMTCSNARPTLAGAGMFMVLMLAVWLVERKRNCREAWSGRR